MKQEIIIGQGKLTWDGSERRSDRYGYVWLLGSGDSTTATHTVAPLEVRPEHLGLRATLRARVIEIRKSTHIGDLFRGVFPTTPQVGDVIVLGTGLLSLGHTSDGSPTVGLRPFDDDRDTDWLDIHALYRCHEQTVQLSYDPLEGPDA